MLGLPHYLTRRANNRTGGVSAYLEFLSEYTGNYRVVVHPAG